MIERLTTLMRAAVRPAVTFELVAVQCSIALAWAGGADAKEAFAALSPFTMAAVSFWFAERGKSGQ